MNHKAAIGWTTTPSLDEAQTLAKGLVETGLVRCAQISTPITSTYIWKGKMETEQEYRITLKFINPLASTIRDYLKSHHPYEIPQWIWVEAAGTSPEYGEWLES
jgi:periplasmic divalent cation tolerance protein